MYQSRMNDADPLILGSEISMGEGVTATTIKVLRPEISGAKIWPQRG